MCQVCQLAANDLWSVAKIHCLALLERVILKVQYFERTEFNKETKTKADKDKQLIKVDNQTSKYTILVKNVCYDLYVCISSTSDASTTNTSSLQSSQSDQDPYISCY